MARFNDLTLTPTEARELEAYLARFEAEAEAAGERRRAAWFAMAQRGVAAHASIEERRLRA